MGNSTSKAARKLPINPKTKPSWAGARTGEAPSNNPNASRPTPRVEGGSYASESKDQTIANDAQDPHMNPDFMRNLGRIGQVKVDHHMSSFRAQTTRTQNMFNARANAELQASSPSHATRNRVAGPTLAALLTRRHEVAPGSSELKNEALRSGMDAEVLERVARYVNAPAVQPGSEKKRVGDDGVEHVEMTAMWKAPQL